MKIQNITILVALGVAIIAFVYLQGKPHQKVKAPAPTIIQQAAPITIEYTRNSELMPPVHVTGAVSIHIIADESGKLTDIQVFPLPSATEMEEKHKFVPTPPNWGTLAPLPDRSR